MPLTRVFILCVAAWCITSCQDQDFSSQTAPLQSDDLNPDNPPQQVFSWDGTSNQDSKSWKIRE